MARKSRRSSGNNALFSLGSMRIYKSDLFEMAGVAGASAVGSIVNKFSQGKLAGNSAQAVGGVALAYLGGRRGGQMAKGVLKKTGGDFLEDNVFNKFLGMFGSGSSSSIQAVSIQSNGATF